MSRYLILLALAACGPGTQSFPLEAPEDADASFEALDACAQHLKHKTQVTKTSVRVLVSAERRLDFVFGKDGVTMSTWVANDGDRGELPKLKVLGETL